MAARPEQIAELDRELKECLKAGEHLDALDICEEIEDLDAMEVRHWLAMARCLVELRRKADARRAWMRALDLDPDQKEALEGLNKHFPGWRTQAARSARESAKPAAAAPPRRRPAAPAPSAGETMTSQPPAAPPPAQPAAGPRASASGLAASPAAAPAPASSPDGPVNWNYVLEDVADAEADRATR